MNARGLNYTAGVRNGLLAAIAAGLLIVPGFGSIALAGDDEPSVRIGIVSGGPSARDIGYVEALKSEISNITRGNYRVEFPEDATIDGGWTRAGVSAAVDGLLSRSDLDLVIAVGVESGAAVCALQEWRIPVIVTSAFAECAAECEDSPDLRINTVDLGQMMARDLRAFREVVSFSNLAVLTEPVWIDDCKHEEVASVVAPDGVRVSFVAVQPDDRQVVSQLPTGTEAVYLMPMRQLDEESFTSLVQSLTAAGIPTFSLLPEDVELGVLATLNTDAILIRSARATALDVLDLLDGRFEEREPVKFLEQRPTVNMATARELGINLSWEILSEARLLNREGSRDGRAIDLASAMDRAVQANLVLLVEDRMVAAGQENIREAKASYRPQIDVALAGVQIDENHAIAALGQYPRYAAGSLELTQLIYSDAASANITAQKELQEARLADRESLRLDISRNTVTAYLGLMSAEAAVRIRQDDVDLNRTNLDLARLRHAVGSAGVAEVYRWEAQQAAARASLLDAISMRRKAERQLSRLLDHPVTSHWLADKPTLESGLAVIGDPDLAPLLDNPNGYDQISLDLLDRGLAMAPELAALDAVIRAQERAYSATKRASYAPTVGISGTVSHILAKDTSGGLDLGDIGELIPEFDDTAWQVGVQASLPVVTGGANKARRLKAKEELYGLRLDRRNAEELISQRILSALDDAAASWPAISLRRQSADAAAKTLELVQDAYGRGAASILDLLDAQNAALSAEFAAETAVYAFLDDWAEVQRAVADLGPTAP